MLRVRSFYRLPVWVSSVFFFSSFRSFLFFLLGDFFFPSCRDIPARRVFASFRFVSLVCMYAWARVCILNIIFGLLYARCEIFYSALAKVLVQHEPACNFSQNISAERNAGEKQKKKKKETGLNPGLNRRPPAFSVTQSRNHTTRPFRLIVRFDKGRVMLYLDQATEVWTSR